MKKIRKKQNFDKISVWQLNLTDFLWLSLAHDLARGDQGGFNDPYIRVFLSPEVDTRKRETTIHRNESNPFFDEHFKFPVSTIQNKLVTIKITYLRLIFILDISRGS